MIYRTPLPRVDISKIKSPLLKIISWNVAGIRGVLKKDKNVFQRIIDVEKPDVLSIQETKISNDQEGEFAKIIPGYTGFFNSGTAKKGYAGTCVFVKDKDRIVSPVTYGMGEPEADAEGRAITIEFENLIVISLYVPNSGMKLDRLEYRVTKWDDAIRKYISKQIETKKKPVCYLGDLNVAHEDADIYNYDAKHVPKVPGCTPKERACHTKFLKEMNMFDSLRALHPDAKGAFTYWSTRFKNRDTNKGLRLDYLIFSSDGVTYPAKKEKSDSDKVELLESFIMTEETVGFSDHAPTGATVAFL